MMIFTIIVASLVLSILVVGPWAIVSGIMIIKTDSNFSEQAFALDSNNVLLYERTGDNSSDNGIIIKVSTEDEEEEEDGDNDEARNVNDQAICAVYLETCPTPRPPLAGDTAKQKEEDIRKRYFEEGSRGTTIAITPTPAPPTTTITPPPPAIAVTSNNISRVFNASEPATSGINYSNNTTVIPAAQQEHASYLNYQNTNLGFRIQYPNDWQLQGDPNTIIGEITGSATNDSTANTTVIFFSPLKDSGLRIQIGKISQEQQQDLQQIEGSQSSLHTIIKSYIDKLSTQYPDFQLINVNATALVHDSARNIIPAYEVVFSYTSSNPSQLGLSSSLSAEQQQQQFPPSGKSLFGMIIFATNKDKAYLIEAYSEITPIGVAQRSIYSNNLIALLKMVNTFKIL